MSSRTQDESRLMALAMTGAAAVTAQIVSGKATRDALFLTSLDYTSLPTMLIATSVFSLLLVALNTRAARRLAPSTLVPSAFAASGVLFLVEWLVRPLAPASTAVAVYLHISCAGPLLASGFWLVSTERFDPRTAKRRFGQIAGMGTLGGLVSAIVAERIGATLGAPALLPFLALLQFACAALVRPLALKLEPSAIVAEPAPDRSGLRAVAAAPHLRQLAYVVLLGTTSAALLDYLFKAQATETFGRGDQLLRFFAVYYAATSVLTFVVQVSSARVVLERFGIALSASSPSLALFVGSAINLVLPGFASLTVARSAEAVFRGSLFRTGYELFYTPMRPEEKRATKAIIDVGFDRVGDAIGGSLVRVMLLLAPALQANAILFLGVLGSAGTIAAASRLKNGYMQTLESSLRHRADGAGVLDSAESTSSIDIAAIQRFRQARPHTETFESSRSPREPLPSDVRDILRLKSRNRDQVMAVLVRQDGLTPTLVSHVIPLLAWDNLAEHAVYALRKVAEEHVGALVDALIDPNQDFAVRRRLVRVFSVCVSQRAADGLMFGLDDARFDVRFQAARSLTEILEKNPTVVIDSRRVFDVVEREASVGRPVWESRRLLDGVSSAESLSPLDEFVRDRAGTSLAHVFTLLALVLPREPLQIAFRSLQTDDQQLQGTALEYLDGILPVRIRERLWPFLELRPTARTGRPREEVIAELLRSHRSITINLESLYQRNAAPSTTLG
ncbi:MAG TPA: Npt1/Npt2 family nucleotide transporter [Vicinamibacterales bacterium]|nr:Npt1/Npt2 family nucleotide transporter [Vicinamibacterales bacterium]